MKIKSPTAKQVLARMEAGETLYPIGFASNYGIFEKDRIRVSHRVIYNLIKAGKINRPIGTSIYNPFTLNQ